MQSPIMERFPVEVVQHSSLSTPPNTDMVAFRQSPDTYGSNQKGKNMELQVGAHEHAF